MGYSVYGETNVPAGLSGVTAIACGDYHDLALKPDGTVAGWGQSTYFQTTNAAATNVVAVAAGGQNSMALRANGSVVTWGISVADKIQPRQMQPISLPLLLVDSIFSPCVRMVRPSAGAIILMGR